MYLLKIQIISIAISHALFYEIQWQRHLKKLFRQPDSFKKPFDCFRCNMFWIGQISGLVILPNVKAYLFYTAINYLTSVIIDKLQNGSNF